MSRWARVTQEKTRWRETSNWYLRQFFTSAPRETRTSSDLWTCLCLCLWPIGRCGCWALWRWCRCLPAPCWTAGYPRTPWTGAPTAAPSASWGLRSRHCLHGAWWGTHREHHGIWSTDRRRVDTLKQNRPELQCDVTSIQIQSTFWRFYSSLWTNKDKLLTWFSFTDHQGPSSSQPSLFCSLSFLFFCLFFSADLTSTLSFHAYRPAVRLGALDLTFPWAVPQLNSWSGLFNCGKRD